MTANTMKFMLYFMAVMMVVFVWGSPAGLGLYWVVGNIYSTLQSYLGQLGQEKRLEKLKQKHAKRMSQIFIIKFKSKNYSQIFRKYSKCSLLISVHILSCTGSREFARKHWSLTTL